MEDPANPSNTVPNSAAPDTLNGRVWPLANNNFSEAERSAIDEIGEPWLGVAISGGGSRSLSAAMGQLRGLTKPYRATLCGSSVTQRNDRMRLKRGDFIDRLAVNPRRLVTLLTGQRFARDKPFVFKKRQCQRMYLSGGVTTCASHFNTTGRQPASDHFRKNAAASVVGT